MIDHAILKVSSYGKWNIQRNIVHKYQYGLFRSIIISILFTRGIVIVSDIRQLKKLYIVYQILTTCIK